MKTQFEMVEVANCKFGIEHTQDNLRINLTQMSKPYGDTKKPGQWLRTDEAQDYLKVISVMQKCTTKDLVQIRQSGNAQLQGTWCKDYHIALRFAQWLSAEFSYAVDDFIIRTMTKQAQVPERIAGVRAISDDNQTGYPRRELLEACSYSPDSGSNHHRRKKFPEHHIKIYRTYCFTEWLARRVFEMGKERQLSLFGHGAVLTCGN